MESALIMRMVSGLEEGGISLRDGARRNIVYLDFSWLYVVSVCTEIFAKKSWKSRNSRGYPLLSVCCMKFEPC